LTKSSDVVIVGGGVAACATTYYLTAAGAKVTLIEKESIGCKSSGYALGLLNPLEGTGIPGPTEPLVRLGYKMHTEMWDPLQQESGVDIQASLMPSLELCFTQEDVKHRKHDMSVWTKVKEFNCTWLSAKEVLSLEPRISPNVMGAVLIEKVGVLDSYRFTLALAQAAEKRGAKVRHGTVTGLQSSGSKITGAVLGREVIPCDAVVIAMGPWSGAASNWLDFNLSVMPLKGEILYLEAASPSITYHLHGPCSILQKKDGRVWVAATVEDAGFDDTTTSQARHTLVKQALHTIPSLASLRVVNQTACLRPIAPDRLPVIGRVPGKDNAYLATAGEKKGILIGPAMGKAVADLIIRGRTDVPIAPVYPERLIPTKPRA
jgi:glycine oxidase